MDSDSSPEKPSSSVSPLTRGEGNGDRESRRQPLKKRLRRLLLILLGAIGLLAALSFGYRQLKKFQTSSLDQQALNYLQQGKAKEAQMSLQTALRLNPSDPVALRLQARLQQSQGEGIAGLQAYQQLARSGKMSLVDVPPFALLAERQGDFKLADRLADAAFNSNPSLGHLIRADLLKLRGKPTAAADELRLAIKESQVPPTLPKVTKVTKESSSGTATKDTKSPAVDPKAAKKMMSEMGDTARMGLVDLLMKQGGAIHPGDPAKSAAEALPLIKELASRDNEASALALTIGLRSGIVPAPERSAWINKLRSHPKVTPEMLLLADAAAIQYDPNGRGVIISGMIERARKETPEQRLAVAQLLLQMKEPASVAELISRDEAMKSPSAFFVWMQAKEMTGNHGDILKALDLSSNPLPPHLRDLYRAAELKANKETAKGDEAFQKALADHVIHGKKGPERLETLVFLNTAGEQALFEQGLQVVLADPTDAESSVNAILGGVQRQRDSAKLLRIMELAAATPSLSGNVRLLNDLAYLRLVLSQPVEMRDLVSRREANPNEFAFRVTESLALIQAGKNARALELLESIEADVDASKLPPRQMAVLAMAVALNGDMEKAYLLLANSHPETLSRQELAMIRQKVPPAHAESPGVSPAAAVEPAAPATAIPPAETNTGCMTTNNIPLL